MNFAELTIAQFVSGLAAKEFSAREAASFYIRNIQERDEDIHAYLFFDEKGVLAEADAVDKKIASGEISSSVMGVPIAVKDNMLIAGGRATAASKILASYGASYTATAVDRLKKGGAVILGKTNMDEFAMGSSTENSAFGPTKNPYDTGRVPGGSSGGSAAAVAADLAMAALGSDTGGSIRQPAAFCGVVGLKPTYGSVSRHGLVAMASSLDQIGPLAKTAEDAAALFGVIRGKDRYDATTAVTAGARRVAALPAKERIRIGVPKEYFAKGLDDDVARSVRVAIGVFERLGMEIREVSLPHTPYALAAYYVIMPAEVSSNLARYDGIRYGNSSARAATLAEVYEKSRGEGFGAETKRRIMLGTFVLSAGYYDAYYTKAQKVRRRITEDFQKAFTEADVLMGPTTPTPAFRIGEKMNDPLAMYLADTYTVAMNLAGLPALSLPCGRVERDGVFLPVGLQIIGKWFDEPTILSLAHLYEQST